MFSFKDISVQDSAHSKELTDLKLMKHSCKQPNEGLSYQRNPFELGKHPHNAAQMFQDSLLCVSLLLLYTLGSLSLSGEWLKCYFVEWCWLWLTGEKNINNMYCQLRVEENHLVLLNSGGVLTARTGLVRHGGTWRSANEAGFVSEGWSFHLGCFGAFKRQDCTA